MSATDPPKVPTTDPPSGPPEPPKTPAPEVPAEPGPTGPFEDPGHMVAPQAPNSSPLRTEAIPDGVTSLAADLGAGMVAPQAPGPEIRTDGP